MMELTSLKGQVALISGAARGIGLGIAECMAKAGADVALLDLPSHGEDEPDVLGDAVAAVKRHGVDALGLTADVTDRDGLRAAFEKAVAHFGRVTIVVSNAAASLLSGEVADWTDDEAWAKVHRTFDVCQFGAIHLCQLAAEHMRERQRSEQSDDTCGGKILIISSIMSIFSSKGRMAYTMSKSALNMLGYNLAKELAPYKVNVNIIQPGYIDTPGERRFATEEEIAEAGEGIPWGRLGRPDDIGNAAVFLCSAAANYVTGSTLKVDGGYMTGMALPFAVKKERNLVESGASNP